MPLYPKLIKHKTTIFFPYDFYKSQIQFERYPVIKSDESYDFTSSSARSENADEFYGEIRQHWWAQTNKTIFVVNANKGDRIINSDRHLFV